MTKSGKTTIAIVYWSGTGNTEKMAWAISDAISSSGLSVDVFTSATFTKSMFMNYDIVLFGCPSMGTEELEESEFEPMYNSIRPLLLGKSIVLFGSYGWGNGEWMRNWEAQAIKDGAVLIHESLICQGADIDKCHELGREVVASNPM